MDSDLNSCPRIRRRSAVLERDRTSRLNVNVFNSFNAEVSNIDYYFTSRLQENRWRMSTTFTSTPRSRTVRVSLIVGL